VAQVRLKAPGIVSLVGQGEPAGMPEHVRVSLELEPGGLTGALDHAGEARRRKRSAALRRKDEGRFRFLLALCSRRRARISSPRIGCVLGVPFFALRTAMVPALKSIWSQRRSVNSLALRP